MFTFFTWLFQNLQGAITTWDLVFSQNIHHPETEIPVEDQFLQYLAFTNHSP